VSVPRWREQVAALKSGLVALRQAIDDELGEREESEAQVRDVV
jgi:hypothetical protein